MIKKREKQEIKKKKRFKVSELSKSQGKKRRNIQEQRQVKNKIK